MWRFGRALTAAAQVTSDSRDCQAGCAQWTGAAFVLADMVKARLDIRTQVNHVEVPGDADSRITQDSVGETTASRQVELPG